VNAVFRAVHSIKGGAGAFNLDELVHFAHVFESVLDHLRAGRLAPSGEVLKTMLRAADMLADVVRAARDGAVTDAARRDALSSELRALDPDAVGKDLDVAIKKAAAMTGKAWRSSRCRSHLMILMMISRSKPLRPNIISSFASRPNQTSTPRPTRPPC
jgi:chemotaxis protein histidine kinase CheA